MLRLLWVTYTQSTPYHGAFIVSSALHSMLKMKYNRGETSVSTPKEHDVTPLCSYLFLRIVLMRPKNLGTPCDNTKYYGSWKFSLFLS